MPIYKREMLITVAKHFGMENPKAQSIPSIQRFLMLQKGDKDLFEFYEELLTIIEKESSGNDFKKLKESLNTKIAEDGRFKCGKSGDDFMWIKSADGVIGNSDCHYEFCADGANSVHKKGYVYVELHCEGKNFEIFKPLANVVGVEDFKWHEVGLRLNSKGYEIKKCQIDDLADTLFEELCALDEIIGDEAKSIIQNSVPNYWWLVANPKIWSFDALKVGEKQEYNLFNDNGNKRRIFQNFLNAKVGDNVVGYESTPRKQIVAMAEVSRASDGETVEFAKREYLLNPIDYCVLKDFPELQEMEFIKNPHGSLFKLTKEEYDIIMDLIREENPLPPKVALPVYTEEDFLNDVYVSKDDFNALKHLLISKQNIILQGAPGVGKTFAAKRLCYALMGEVDESRVEFVQFHQNYSYEDFIMGYKPSSDGGFTLKRGLFYNFCKRAQNEPDSNKKYFFIIDEINRGNLSKVFGELLMLIEKEYRGDKHAIKLAYSDELFSVPENVYIIGMMNTADRSLAMIDYALRRRFSFFDMQPGFESEGFVKYMDGLNSPGFNKLIEAVKRLNGVIANDGSLGKGFCIGHSYFCNQTAESLSPTWMRSIVEYDIIPMLREYWFDNKESFKSESEEMRKALA